MNWNMNEVEQKNISTLREALKLLYGDECILRESNIFTGTGVGTLVEIEFVYLINGTHHTLRKDVTDYDCW